MITFGTIALSAIAPSLTNPRKTFDDTKLHELADSITASGVHQAVLLRPLPAGRIEDTSRLSPRPEFELVTGERRYRASLMAKAENIPAMIRELSDDQVLEIQIVENLQRDDLTALEEAHGYQALMDHSHLSADQVGVKIGKSRSYVFGRLKLLDMGQDCRDALRMGLIDASKALLLARIPSTSLQCKALKEIVRANHPEGVMSYRMAHDWIKSRYMLKIEQAPFDHADTSLAPRACSICPTRTGADADLFMDVMGADMCTDPDCYAGKVQQHHSRRRAQFEAKGHQIIDGADAEALMPYPNSPPEGYARLDDVSDSPTDKPLRQELAKLIDKGDVVPVMIVNPHQAGELIACVPEDDVSKLLDRAGRKKAAAAAKSEQAAQDKKSGEARERKLRLEYETVWRLKVLDGVHAELVKDPSDALTPSLARLAGERLIRGDIDPDVAAHLCDLLGLDKNDCDDALVEWMTNPTPLTVHDALALLIAACGAGYFAYLGADSSRAERESHPLLNVAKAIGLDVDALKSQVKIEMAEREKPSIPLAPAAQAVGVRGGKAKSEKGSRGKKSAPPAGATAPSARISEADAIQGIAAAMQSMEGAQAPHAGLGAEPGADAPSDDATVRRADRGPLVGDRIRIKADAFTATVTALGKGGGVWAYVDDIASTCVYDRDEFELLSPPQQEAPDGQGRGLKDLGVKRPDALLDDAVDLVKEAGTVSVRQIKAALGIGTERAMRIIGQLERDGVVSACDGNGGRKVLVAA